MLRKFIEFGFGSNAAIFSHPKESEHFIKSLGVPSFIAI